jgi:transcriptional regulator with XRE-family HTH domain
MIDDRASQGVHQALAANLRRMRIARRLSLSELARATGVSKATLSGIENVHANPTVGTLVGLAGALRVSLGELLEETPQGEIRIVRSGQLEPAERGSVPQRLLDAFSSGGSIEIAELVLAARERYEVEGKGDGARAHLFVLAGKLIAGPVERYSEFAGGDYVSFPADVPHLYETARHPARALLLSHLAG